MAVNTMIAAPRRTRRPHTAPCQRETEQQVLRREIRQLCAMIDRRHGNPPGRAEKAVYWHYHGCDTISAGVLRELHADAVDYLRDGQFRDPAAAA